MATSTATTTNTTTTFKPALIVVDMQEDFCPPNGTLAVPSARALTPTINTLLALPFALKIATQDWHPINSTTFAQSHLPPDNIPFVTKRQIPNPFSPSQYLPTTLWPVHCIQETPGASIIPEINSSAFDLIVKKGMDKRVEQYSAFGDIFGNKNVPEGVSLDLGRYLEGEGVSHVFLVGVAGDLCVRYSAVDARKEGFETVVVKEGIACVDEGDAGWGETKRELEEVGVKVVGVEGEEVGRVRALA
ncbi:MAG: NAD(+) salvage pathway protein [Cirrosporium novae-zelandiae]|nr:MAG: NAD(+) salvage pathway protein [Cirrosporium novae-zelandiae]